MTTTTPGVAAIIKTDKLGRMRTSRERRAELLREFEQSGLSGPKFAALVGIKYQTLASWLQARRRQASGKAAGPTVKWLEAVVESPAGSAAAGVVLELPGGVRMIVGDAKAAELAAVVVRALSRPC